MADSIWASIDAQLDAVVEDVPQPQQKTTPTFKGKIWLAFAGLMIIISALWWHLSHQAPAPALVPKVPPLAPVIKEPPPAAPKKDTLLRLPQKPAPVSPIIISEDTLQTNDSTTADSVVERILPIMKMEPPLKYHKPAPDSATVAPAPKVKPPKGVSGITSDDYRIGVEKDSTKKKVN